VPVLVSDTTREALPRQIGEIHILPAEDVFDPAHDLDALVAVFETDREWIKEMARLSDRSREWLARERDSALLLRGNALKAAETWSEGRPASMPTLPSDILELVVASRLASARLQRRAVSDVSSAPCPVWLRSATALEC